MRFFFLSFSTYIRSTNLNNACLFFEFDLFEELHPGMLQYDILIRYQQNSIHINSNKNQIFTEYTTVYWSPMQRIKI